MSRSVFAALVVALVMVALAGCGGSHSTASPRTSKRTLTDLRNINELQTAFNTASGEPRLIVLVSPT